MTTQDDKKRGVPYSCSLIEGFNQELLDTNLRDLELIEHPYTWGRGRGTTEWMEIRIDRALVTSEWISMFSMAKLFNLEDTSFDHSPLLLEPKVVEKRYGKKRFRFENAWLSKPICEQIIKDSWEGYSTSTMQEEVRVCGEMLECWGREVTGNFGR